MREDFKYPYRTITRKEEVEGNKALGEFFGSMLILPFLLIELLACYFPFIEKIKFYIYGFIIGVILYLIIF